jgi:glutamate---cysteine ligase / carboxylate-amine ligase
MEHARRRFMLDAYTIGVEEEYQLVDPESGGLLSRASDVLSTDWADALQGELHETTVEIGTAICVTCADVEQELKRRRFQAATTAAAEGLEIVAAGLHPFSGWEGHEFREAERYRAIRNLHDRVAREVNIFGMHVHVGVPEHQDRTRLMRKVRGFIPHLVALSASSPFLDADDTGFSSYRAVLWRQFPYTGIPPRFDSEEEYDRFIDLLLRSEAIRDRGNIYWSIRPHFSYPTLEFRAMDAVPSAHDAATIAALVRLLVVGVAESRIRPPGGGELSPDLWHTVLTENEWHAARFGLAASLTDPETTRGRTSVRTAIRRFLDEAAPIAAELGETVVLDRAEQLLQRGNSSDRMRQVYAEHRSYQELVAWLVRETVLGTGFDRRRSQRVDRDRVS